jgi:hypothetical protein
MVVDCVVLECDPLHLSRILCIVRNSLHLSQFDVPKTRAFVAADFNEIPAFVKNYVKGLWRLHYCLSETSLAPVIASLDENESKRISILKLRSNDNKRVVPYIVPALCTMGVKVHQRNASHELNVLISST